MANRRMISKDIFYDDGFTDLNAETRLLYTYLILNADDDGMLTSTKQAMFLAGADKNDLQTLVDAGYLYDFSSGVYVIRHWNMMNKVQPTRKTDTMFQNEKSELILVNDVYCRQNVDKVSTQGSLGQDSTSKDSLGQDSTGQGSSGQGSEGKVTFDDDDSSSSQKNALDEILGQAMNEINDNPELREILEVFKNQVAPLRNPNDIVTLCDLHRIYGKNHLLMAMATANKNQANSIQYVAKVCNTLANS